MSRVRQFLSGLSVTTVTGIIAVAVTLSAFAVLRWQASTATITAGFWYEDFPFTLPEDDTVRLGGPLTHAEIEAIKLISRRELERAFSGLRIVFTESRDAFWRIRVLRDIGPGVRRALPRAGEAYAMGPLGGAGSVGFLIVALGAIDHAPPGVSRQDIIEGIGRGIGRTAAHELGHIILGVNFNDRTDGDSYEYGSTDRASQYYGELHWTTAWPLLQQKIGK